MNLYNRFYDDDEYKQSILNFKPVEIKETITMSEKFLTPIAPCKYPHLQVPNTDPKGIYKDRFKITLVLDKANPKHLELMTHISSLDREGKGLGKKKKENLTEADMDKLKIKNPVKRQVDKETGKYTELYEITFGTSPEFVDQVPTVDAHNTPIKRDKNFVANDSMVRIGWSYNFYSQDAGGVSLFLGMVQIVELIEWTGGNPEDYGCEPTEGYVSDKVDDPGYTEEPEKPSAEDVEEIKKESPEIEGVPVPTGSEPMLDKDGNVIF